uniref:ATP synthase F0 subunit 8 n=1 Tax=Verrallia virginica TaxID=115334 RepID=UPI0026E46731|nr:ATP synthase F0 subunit 8 [Verrallia virginica]WJW73895.1 ATP synthase F0 subunit 8 [Verrallia virginica]
MPQMSPIGWLSLFMVFSFMFIMINIMNYYVIIYKSNHKLIKSKYNYKTINWMW